ncbi:3-oxoacyl-acyl-carrier reductase [Fusarium longipes]|uniref:3-oxoacyl-acyl-carrier reductase n=1 Tax=Fusarium longipes TaxID=694270 RepID=A0A395T1J1_9HYPO|nr:3-oxoacyl-acyl-carrier reductase [Fusarium longipes]
MVYSLDVPGYALITGGGSGIGRATALLLAREGSAGIALADLAQGNMQNVKEELEAVATNAKFSCITIAVDVTDSLSVKTMVKMTVEVFGRLDYAVNSAGVAFKSLGIDTTMEDWDRIIGANLTGTFNSMKEEARQMLTQEPLDLNSPAPLQRGAIVNISSIAGMIGIRYSSAYVASKHGVSGLTKNFALDYPEIKINAVAPGYVATPMTAAPGEMSRNAKEKVANSVPLKRFGLPEEIAETIVWLLSSRSNFVHGTLIAVDGGYTAQ